MNAALINILISVGDEELRLLAQWLVANLPPSLHDFLGSKIGARLLGPASAWVETRGENEAPPVKALYEKLSDLMDAAAHELFTERQKRETLTREWKTELKTAPPQLATALAAHGGMGVGAFLKKLWQMFDAAITSLDQSLAPRLKAHADRLERHPAVRKRLAT